jgi:hypothetical protein
MSIGTTLSHLHESTSALSPEVLDDITEFIYTMRDGIFSVCAVVSRLETLAMLIGEVPGIIQETVTKRYFVDLQSIGTDTLRLYTDAPESEVAIYGYYFNSSHEMLQKKVYKKVRRNELAVDRYDGSGVLVSANESEKQGDLSCWLGDNDFATRLEQEANLHGYGVRYLYKVDKSQSYIRVANIPVISTA